MNDRNITDEYLNLFIDEQLDKAELDALHQQLLQDERLRQRVCQLKAVRELVNYAYESLPADQYETESNAGVGNRSWLSMAASVVMLVGLLSGWLANDAWHAHYDTIVSSNDVFKYFKHHQSAAAPSRNIIMHVTTGDMHAVSKALNEAEQLIASYRQAGTELKLDIVTYREGINMLRVDSSPYIKRLDSLLSVNENVSVYACMNTLKKARKREGRDVPLMPRAITANSAQQLITERLNSGWIYIKV